MSGLGPDDVQRVIDCIKVAQSELKGCKRKTKEKEHLEHLNNVLKGLKAQEGYLMDFLSICL